MLKDVKFAARVAACDLCAPPRRFLYLIMCICMYYIYHPFLFFFMKGDRYVEPDWACGAVPHVRQAVSLLAPQGLLQLDGARRWGMRKLPFEGSRRRGNGRTQGRTITIFPQLIPPIRHSMSGNRCHGVLRSTPFSLVYLFSLQYGTSLLPYGRVRGALFHYRPKKER